MPHVTRLSWTSEQLTMLCELVKSGVSPARASVVLNRPQRAVQSKARQLGLPFPDWRKGRQRALALEARAKRWTLSCSPVEADRQVYGQPVKTGGLSC
jgi:hypothetical protein